MFPTYSRHAYRGKKRFRRKAPTVSGTKLGIKLRVARRKSTTYIDKLGEWIEKATAIGKKYKTFHSDWVSNRVGRYIGGKEKDGRLQGKNLRLFVARYKDQPGKREYTTYPKGADAYIGRHVSVKPLARKRVRVGRYDADTRDASYKIKTASKKREAVRDALFGKSFQKADTNGFHAKPGRKVKAKRFIVQGSFKKKRGSQFETFTTTGTTNN